ncbi:hypothetical protein [Ohtaekwangia sp.]|jgi:hypothetical protein|uniref:hypothetical protein n=1 Tax=Ohtaekwangia sp. TaxID=2066019 RepID=UPI002F9394D7
MSATIRQYLFGAIFFAVGIYQLYRNDFLEAALYLLAALSFVFNTLATEPKLLAYKKMLVIITWSLIIITALVFLYVLQFKFL